MQAAQEDATQCQRHTVSEALNNIEQLRLQHTTQPWMQRTPPAEHHSLMILMTAHTQRENGLLGHSAMVVSLQCCSVKARLKRIDLQANSSDSRLETLHHVPEQSRAALSSSGHFALQLQSQRWQMTRRFPPAQPYKQARTLKDQSTR